MSCHQYWGHDRERWLCEYRRVRQTRTSTFPAVGFGLRSVSQLSRVGLAAGFLEDKWK
jgi:hypothetical protein